MPFRHILLLLFIVAVWGCNFIFIKFGIDEIPPLFLCTLRFFLASVPAVFFVKPPLKYFKYVAFYGLVTFGLQFSLLFLGMKAGMTPGLSSLLIQVQVFFSLFFAAILLKERPTSWQITGAIISFIGIALIAMHFDATSSLTGFVLIIAAAAAWGFGNLVTKKIPQVTIMQLVVWGSFVACLPLLLVSYFIEGQATIVHSMTHITWLGVVSLIYIVYASTWLGYGTWNWMISRYHVGLVVPFSLLVPIFGLLSSIIVFGEPLQAWKLSAGLLVIVGLCINLFGGRLFGYLKNKTIAMEAS